MKIIITEEQHKQLTKETFRDLLYFYWDSQKDEGETPALDDFVYSVTDINKNNSSQDYGIIRPLWYEYNGGYNVLVDKIKNELLDKQFTFESHYNLKMTFEVFEVISSSADDFRAGELEIMCSVVDGTIDGTVYNEEEEQIETVPNMSLRDQYAELEYDTDDFVGFLEIETKRFLETKIEKYGVPFDIEINFL